ncbi:hypothetical protein LP43_1907 [Methylophaga thiooxydans]|uniref:diguanylate cyclase n=2 Tax=Methylophaga thiooxydans TaxID=392484 RepID=A0A0A0BDR9_9GAMM|nr:hypothetical protein LP43_1907 [Methylophaga thiooxydans]
MQFRRFLQRIDQRYMREGLARIGRVRAVINITAIACLSSVLLSSLIWSQAFGREIDWQLISTAFVVPALICPFVMWFVIQMTLDLHHMENKMRHLASYDDLTELLSRRAFLTSSQKLFSLMNRSHKSFSIAYIDIDDFKKINDSYGHAVGDEVLKSFAVILEDHTRSSDVVGRIGGEEFAIALPDTGAHGAARVVELIRKVSEQQMLTASSKATLSYTISIGISTSDSNNTQTLEQLIQQADRALYEAKVAGKNRIIQFETETHFT